MCLNINYQALWTKRSQGNLPVNLTYRQLMSRRAKESRSVSEGQNRNKRQKLGNLDGQIPITSCHQKAQPVVCSTQTLLVLLSSETPHIYKTRGIILDAMNMWKALHPNCALSFQLRCIFSQINLIIFGCEQCASQWSKRIAANSIDGEKVSWCLTGNVSFPLKMLSHGPQAARWLTKDTTWS